MPETRRRAINLVAVPYDSGHRETRMGRGPRALLSGGLEAALRAPGGEVFTEVVEAAGSFLTEN